jgi:3'-5' exoribonuclease
MKKVFIVDCKPGLTIEKEYFGISQYNQAEDKNGRTYLSLKLIDSSGEIDAKVWAEALASLGVVKFKVGDVVSIDASVSEYRGQSQLTISSLHKLADGDYEASDLIRAATRPVEEIYKEVLKFIGEIEDKTLHKLISEIITEHKDLFVKTPAAKSNHHNHYGGLVEHVLEMLKSAERLLELYPQANKDLVYAGILMHDLGKVIELENLGFSYDYSFEGKLIGHIAIGLEILDKHVFLNYKDYKDFYHSENYVLLKHIILSHHGKLEYGSPIVPKTIEAIIVSRVDDLSSQTQFYKRLITDNSASEQAFTPRDYVLGTEVYIGGGERTVKALAEKLNAAIADVLEDEGLTSQAQKEHEQEESVTELPEQTDIFS